MQGHYNPNALRNFRVTPSVLQHTFRRTTRFALAGWPLAPASTSSGSRAARYHWLRRDLRRPTSPADVMKSR